MKHRRILAFITTILATSPGICAQQGTPKQPGSSSTTKSGGSKTIEGCLTRSKESYTLGTRSGDLYELESDGNDLQKFNGQEVRITGPVTPAHAGTSPSNALEQQYARLKVHKIKKVFDTCQ